MPHEYLVHEEGNLLSRVPVLSEGTAAPGRTKDPTHFYSAHMPVEKRGAVTGEQEGGEQPDQ